MSPVRIQNLYQLFASCYYGDIVVPLSEETELNISYNCGSSMMKCRQAVTDGLLDVLNKGNITKTDTDTSSKDTVMRLTLYPTGSLHEVYSFTLTESKLLRAVRGSGAFDESEARIIIEKADEEREKQLSDEVFDSLVELLEQTYLDSEAYDTDKTVLDSWSVEVLYRKKLIKQDCCVDTPKSVQRLYESVIALSPVAVDLNGFA